MKRENRRVRSLILAHGILGTLIVSSSTLPFWLITSPLIIDIFIARALHSHTFPDAVRLLDFSCSEAALHRYWVVLSPSCFLGFASPIRVAISLNCSDCKLIFPSHPWCSWICSLFSYIFVHHSYSDFRNVAIDWLTDSLYFFEFALHIWSGGGFPCAGVERERRWESALLEAGFFNSL